MTFRRQSMAATALAMALVASPAVSVASPGESGRAELPPAAYNVEIPPSTAPAVRSPASSTSEPDAATRAPSSAAATLGLSTYVDDCRGSTGSAYDIRRLTFAMTSDEETTQVTMRPCDPSTLDDFNGQTLNWRTQSTPSDPRTEGAQRRDIEVSGTAGSLNVNVWRVDGDGGRTSQIPGGQAGILQHSGSNVKVLVVEFPSSSLGLSSTCRPSQGTSCLKFRFQSFDRSRVARDWLPNTLPPAEDLDTDRDKAPLWPSRCGADVDPATVGHVRLTTTSTATARDVASALEAAGYRAEPYPAAPYVEVPVGASGEVVNVLETWDEILEVTPVTPRRMSRVPDDPQYDHQWYLPAIGAPSAWDTTTGSNDIGIAIVDNGVAGDHPEFASPAGGSRVEAGWDGLLNTGIGKGLHSDLGGHGTAVAGLAAATGNDGRGVAGVDWRASIVPVRVFDHEGCFVSVPNYFAALDWIAEQAAKGEIHVANFSLGGDPIPGEAERIEQIAEHATVVAAMGNDRDITGSLRSFPAALPDVIAVGATGPDDQVAGYSNHGRHLDVVAPGGDEGGSRSGDIWTMADPTEYGAATPYVAQAGTSFSSPLVAGVAALYRAAHPGSTPADVARALLTTARDLGDGKAGFDISYGFGKVDAGQVLGHSPGQTLVRLAGDDRYETAATIARHAFPDPDLVDVVLLATGQDYPDALAGGPLAAREHAPLLLTPSGNLHDATRQALVDLNPERVLLLGGTAVLSTDVAAELQAMGFEVARAAGGDRYETAKAIALGMPGTAFGWRAWNRSDVAFLATGQNFPDALPGGAAAAANDAPLLLTGRTRLPDATREALLTLQTRVVIVLGGPTAVDDTVLAQLDSLEISHARSEGGDRYETAAVTADCPFTPCATGTRFVVVATGEGFADALGGSAAAAALRAPLLLVPRSGEVPPPVVQALRDLEPEQALVLGGPVPISGQMADKVNGLVVR